MGRRFLHPDAPLPLEDDPLDPEGSAPRGDGLGEGGPEPPPLDSAPVVLSPGATVDIAREAAPSPELTDVGHGSKSPQLLDLGNGTGRYELVRLLAEGAMGEVFLARRIGAAGFVRDVALKRLRTSLAEDGTFRRMFVEEARLASRLHHRAIGAVHDLHEAGGTLYLVMEHVPGTTLFDVLQLAARKGKTLPIAFALYMLAEMADALQYAHALRDEDGQPLGIVHRDLNPDNIMIAETGAVKLLDFGVAFASDPSRERTEAGMMKGTFSYFSPEQAREEEVDGRSDLFALGLVGLEILTGRKLHGSLRGYALLKQIGRADKEVLEHAIANVATGLQDLLRRALAPSPADRFQNGAEMAHAVRAYAVASGLVLSPLECASEVSRLRELSDAAPEAVGTTLPEAAPDERSSPTTVESGTERPSEKAVAAEQRRAQVLEKLRNPENPTRKVAISGLVILAVLVLGNVGVGFLFRRGSGSKVDLVETAAQRQARTELERRAASPVTPPQLPVAGTGGLALAVAPSAAGPVSVRAAQATPNGATTALGQRIRTQRAVASGSSGRSRRRNLDSTTATSFADEAPAAVSDRGQKSRPERLAIPPGTLIPARLLVPADPGAPGPVSAEITQDVRGSAGILVARGATLLCTSSSLTAKRVPLACHAVVTNGESRAFNGTALGPDKRPGLPVEVTGGKGGTGDVARAGALETAEAVGSQLVGDGLGGTVGRGAVRVGGGAARSATAPGGEVAEAAPVGTAFFVFVQGGQGGLP